MNNKFRQSLLKGLRGLLLPVAKYCVNHSVSIQDFLEVSKTAFLEVATEHLETQGTKVESIRLSALTGIADQDVIAIWRNERAEKSNVQLITKIIGQWQQDARFVTAGRNPKILEFVGRGSAFRQLVAAVSKDLNPNSVRLELEHTGVVKRVSNGLKLTGHVYTPRHIISDGLALLADDSADLFESVHENIFNNPRIPNLHIKTHYDNIPLEYMPRIRKWFLIRGMAFHAEAREFLSKFDRDINLRLSKKPGRIRASIGTFSVVQQSYGIATEEDEKSK